MNLFDSTMNTLEKTLDYSSVKNRVISNNIANVDTPNYKAQDVSFKDVLNEELNNHFKAKRTHPKHVEFSSHKFTPYNITTKSNTIYNHNGNNVDIVIVMDELSKNIIYYKSLVTRMNWKLSRLQKM